MNWFRGYAASRAESLWLSGTPLESGEALPRAALAAE